MDVFEHILKRINDKKTDYGEYQFTQKEDLALKTFFDLAQELDSMTDLYGLCIAIPKSFFSLSARLYIINPRENRFMLVSSPNSEDNAGNTPAPEVPKGNFADTDSGSTIFKVRGNQIHLDQLPFKSIEDVIGLMEVGTAENITAQLKFFFVKYTNRMGFNLHNRFLVEKNIEHLRFISSLVADIEHNIISPNIIYKLYIKNLETALKQSLKAEESLRPLIEKLPRKEQGSFTSLMQELDDGNQAIKREVGEISRHHKNMSLFLESLLRRSHFDQGRLTLRKKRCGMLRDVVQPQLERYRERLASMDIAVDHQASGIPEEEVVSVVDVGLMAQVYANLLSNAIKYSTEIDTPKGKKKYITYGHQVMENFFSQDSDGIKYNVFSTGPHIPPNEREHLYEDQFRGSNIAGRPGSGHGLSFIKNIVEIHGGVVGYEPTEFGNNFFFILPKEPTA